jgi:hypothetical protein
MAAAENALTGNRRFLRGSHSGAPRDGSLDDGHKKLLAAKMGDGRGGRRDVVLGKLTGEPVPCGSSFWILEPWPEKWIRSRLNFSCGRRWPTNGFGIAEVRTSWCNVLRRSHTRSGSSTEEWRVPVLRWQSDLPALRSKPCRAEWLSERPAGIRARQISSSHSETLGHKNR